MDPLEEQSMEVEALESIYMDDFKLNSSRENGGPLEFELHLTPHAEADSEPNHVAAALCVRYSDGYPDERPEVLEVRGLKGLVPAQIKQVQEVADRSADECMGMGAIVFTVAEAVKEWLIENNHPSGDGSMYAEMMRRQKERERQDQKEREKREIDAAAALEAEERRKKRAGCTTETVKPKYGTPVSAETFEAWRAAFEAEQQKLDMNDRQPGVPLLQEEINAKLGSGLTGREYFEHQSSAGVGHIDDDAVAQAALEEAKRMQISEPAVSKQTLYSYTSSDSATQGTDNQNGIGAIDSAVFLDDDDEDDDLSDLDSSDEEEYEDEDDEEDNE